MNEKLCAEVMSPDRTEDGYDSLLAGIRRSFSRAVGDEATPLFATDASNLYDLFLDNIPAEARQHYNCNACRHFVNRFGKLVSINGETGKQTAVMWGGRVPEFFRPAVKAVKEKVENARITGVFISDEESLGTAKTGVWTHMAVDMPQKMVFKGLVGTAHQKAAEKEEDYRILLSCMTKYSQQDIETVVNLLRSDALYRAEQILPMAEWFMETMRLARGRKVNRNILWLRAATAPKGFCHIPASMVGTLLDDIAAGYGSGEIKRRFDEKMDPLQYQRPQAAPTAGNVKRAEEIVAKLGIERSLERRYARLDEVQAIWRPTGEKKADTGGVFAGIPIKGKPDTTRNGVEAPETAITFEKFRRTVLPRARKIELLVSHHSDSYAALVTAVHPDAPPIIRWDTEDERNPFSWYLYSGGSLPGRWGLNTGWNEVTAVVLQPNMWSDRPNGYASVGAMFILKGARDRNGSNSACLFPEILKGELREVRSTIEAYSKSHHLSGLDESDACGLIIQSSDKALEVKIRVNSDVGTTRYRIDRWD